MEPGLARTCPRSTSSLSTPRSRHPTLSPACPSSNSFRNISTPVTTVLRVSRNPTISTSSPTLTPPPSTPPTPPPPPPRTAQMPSTTLQNVSVLAHPPPAPRRCPPPLPLRAYP